MKVPVNTGQEVEAEVVEILPQLGRRNSGKKRGKKIVHRMNNENQFA
jgi:hypothetical protein